MCTISPGLLLCRLVHLHGILKRIMCTHSRASFSKLSRWLEDARALGSPHLVTVLVGNKSDREEEREVEWAEASRWAAEHGKLIQDFSLGPWRLTSDDLNNAL